MKKSKIQFMVVLAAISLLLLTANFGVTINREIPSLHESIVAEQHFPLTAVNHDPISINGNVELATFIVNEGLSGEGSYEFPYVIEGFTINASSTDGISIVNTNSYLIIRNCAVSGDNSTYIDGIHLYNVMNANISNNELSWLYRGIFLHDSTNNTLSGNIANEIPNYGIYLSSSSNNTLAGNTVNSEPFAGISLYRSNNNSLSRNTVNNCRSYGITLSSSNNNTLSGNIVSDIDYIGIQLGSSRNNTLIGNLLYRTGLVLFFSYDNHIDPSNKVNDKSVRYYENSVGIHLSGEGDVGQVILLNCNESIIEGLEISNVIMGIAVLESFGCLISENILNGCTNGVYLCCSQNNTLSENKVDGSGLIRYKNGVGVNLELSNNNTLIGNLIYQAGINHYESYGNKIDTTNKVNDKSVRYYENSPGVHLSGESDVGQVIMINCNDSVIEGLSVEETIFGIDVDDSFNCSITNNTLSGCNFGIYVEYSNNATLSDNTLYDNGYGINCYNSNDATLSENMLYDNGFGIHSINSNNNTLFGNIAFNNDYGIYLSISNNNTLSSNIAFNNDYGIHLYLSGNNTIYFNEIYGNQNTQALVRYGSTNNQWDNGTTGNYWGKDYISKYPAATNDGTVWDIPYEIDGDEVGIDHFPLVNPIFPDEIAPQFTISPADCSINEGFSELNVSWTLTDFHPATYTIELDGTENVSATAWTVDIAIMYEIPDELSLGMHNITIIVLDESGHIAHDTFMLTVIDGAIPQFIESPEDWSVDDGISGLSISWTATDLHPAIYTVELDGFEVVSTTAWTSGTAISYDIPEGLAIGEHNITIIVVDESGNIVQDTVIFTVSEHETTVDPTDESHIPGFPLMPIFIFMSIGGVWLRRKINSKMGN